MKKIILVIILSMFMLVSGCGNAKNFNGKHCTTYGIFNKEFKCEGVEYEIIVGNVFWALVFSETLIVPFYFFGFSFYQPVKNKNK